MMKRWILTGALAATVGAASGCCGFGPCCGPGYSAPPYAAPVSSAPAYVSSQPYYTAPATGQPSLAEMPQPVPHQTDTTTR